jgi:hypothetical protein
LIHYFGKKPARPGAIRFMATSYVDLARLPTPPIVFGHVNNAWPFGELGNDACGDCVWAGAAHETQIFRAATRKPWPRFTEDSVVKVYSQETGYVPGVPSTDDGTDMQAAAEFRRVTGMPDADGALHFIKAYATIPITNDQHMLDLIVKLTFAFGLVGCGFRMQQVQGTQFDEKQPWGLVRGSPIVGGHYVPIVGRNSRGNLVGISWGRTTGITPVFMMEQLDEVIVYLSQEYLMAGGQTPHLLNEAQLDADLAALSIPSAIV